MREVLFNKRVLSWAFYDWANSAFAMTVMATFFPIMFKDFYNVDVPATVSTARLAFVAGAGGLAVAILAPILGAVADRTGRRKGFLLGFAALGVVGAGGLAFVSQGNWLMAAWVYGIASIGFMFANVFNDALVTEVSPPGKVELVSSFGFSLGYLGSSLLFLLHSLIASKPELIGVESQSDAVRIAFLSVAIWWAAFSLPLVFYVKESPPSDSVSGWQAIRGGLSQIVKTFREIRQIKPVLIFLLAYWLYIDGVYTIIKMAVDFGLSLGLDSGTMIIAIIIVNFVGFPATLIAGALGARFGPKAILIFCVLIYLLMTVASLFLYTKTHFLLMALAIGLVQGAVQSMSRALFARLIPPKRSGEFFGFYNMSGRFAAVVGPFLVGGVALATGDSRLPILSLVVLLLPGLFLLLRVREPNSETQPAVQSAGL